MLPIRNPKPTFGKIQGTRAVLDTTVYKQWSDATVTWSSATAQWGNIDTQDGKGPTVPKVLNTVPMGLRVRDLKP